MKLTRVFLMLFLGTNLLVLSQNPDNLIAENRNPEFFIGFDTGTSNNFAEIYETLINTDGINVISYCERNNIIKLSFDKDVFKELKSIFDLIEKQFNGAICYKKNYKEESYQKMCSEELLKRNMGGIE